MENQHDINVSIDARLRGLEVSIRSIHGLLEEKDKRYDERFEAQENAVKVKAAAINQWIGWLVAIAVGILAFWKQH